MSAHDLSGTDDRRLVRSGTVRHVAFQRWGTAPDFAAGSSHGTAVVGDLLQLSTPSGQLVYTDPFGAGRTATFDVGTWTSPLVSTPFPYTELVASWNARTPPDTWIQVSVHGHADDGSLSKPYVLGRWAEDTGTIHRTSVPAQGDTLATVDIDTLVAHTDRSLTTWQLTVSLFRRSGTAATPTVSMVGAMTSALPRAEQVEVSLPGGAAGIELDVPAYSQELHRGHYPEYNNGGEAWCSPTSTAMVLAYWQQRDPAYGPDSHEYADYVDPDPWIDFAAARTYDGNFDGTGNWPFNTAYAARYGLDAFVTRLRSLTEAEQFVESGIPLIVSVSFKEAQLTGSGYDTDGHLMVIRGFTTKGDVIANDPASHLDPKNEAVRTVYDRAEFENVWLPTSGGIAYVIRPRDVPLPPHACGAEPSW